MNSKTITKHLFANLFFLAVLLSSISTLYAQDNPAPVTTSKFTVREDNDRDGIKNRKDKCSETPAGVAVDAQGCPLDTDKDGVADYLDKCPDVPGSAGMNGCQDKDKDDVADNDDICPDVPGSARFKGCPDSDDDGIDDAKDKCPNAKGLDMFQGCPDTDGDGIADTKDKCPDTQKGINVDVNGCNADIDKDGVTDTEDKCPDTKTGIKVDSKGCPSDTDADGVVDTEDKCPSVMGDAKNNGCPDVAKRLEFAARGISFETGNATIKPSSYPMLDEVVSIISEYKDYDLKMGGHTDNVGNDASNLKLSQSRVDAVKTYLVSKGVSESRIAATGYGETIPIGDNNTTKGKEQNRRVELELVLRTSKK